MDMKKFIIFMSLGFCMTGCMTAGEHKAAVQDSTKDKLTLGTVQKEIRVGMNSVDVIRALGAANMVTKGSTGNEVWVYDKFSTLTAQSTSSGGVSALVLRSAGIGVGSQYTQGSGASATSQRTLTVIIHFDQNMKVKKFDYHSTSY
jgi:hypothetical protein